MEVTLTDIVERLRKAYPPLAGYQRHVGEEAADEIERLHALLDGDAAEIMRLIRENERLRRALEPKP